MPGGRTVESLVILGKILLINIVLSGDNAILIGMAGKHLPKEQQAKAVWWGAAGAVVLRIALIGGAVLLLRIPWIQSIGAVFLLYIAIKLLVQDGPREPLRGADSFASAIWTIITADLIMSLDNVLAIAAIADGDWLLIIIGIMTSIPVIVWGSAFVMRLLERFPALVFIGSGVLGYTAGEMILKDQAASRWLPDVPGLHWTLPIAAAIAVVAAGWWKRKTTPA